MPTHLPSMTSLRAFEAAARHSSFARAAQELNLTPTAISHRIHKLEELLGVKLFARDHGAVRLTEPAHDYLRTVRTLILELSEATGRAMHRSRDRELFVGCMPTFAVKCLMPKLDGFISTHRDIALHLWTILTSDALTRRDFDIAFFYGTGDWPGFVSHKLNDEEIFPVCSPALVAGKKRPRKPADLASHTVIRTAYSFILQDDWPVWLEAAGEKDLQFASEITCDLLMPSMQAAIDGLGFAIGRSGLVAPDLAAKTLVAPFALKVPTNRAYYLVSPPERADYPAVRLFRDWALARFGASR